jgi:hypothetical protein
MKPRVCLAIGFLLLSAVAFAAEPAAPSSGATILDLDLGSWVGFARWKTPSMADQDGKPVPLPEPARKGVKEEDRQPWQVVASAQPARDWETPGFDDTQWFRLAGALSAGDGKAGLNLFYAPGAPAEWQLFCLRGKFRVDDPAHARDLKLQVRYVGGVRVCVNGQELCRGHLAAGKIDLDTLATPYPDEAYIRAGVKSDGKELMKARTRELGASGSETNVVIPASMLRRGINVVAVEAHAAPLSSRMHKEGPPDNLNWSHVGVLLARLSAGAGVTPSVGNSGQVELWNSQQMETDFAWHFALPADRIRPIRMVGARNGYFSGKVVMSSPAAIQNLKASVSDLATADGKARIPAASVQVRWAERATPQMSSGTHWDVPQRVTFDRLLGEFPAEIPALSLIAGRWRGTVAVVPVWVTVHVPSNAAPGAYTGALTIEAQGAAPVKFAVPLELGVQDWRIPDPQEFGIHHNLYQSPDTVARYYNVPLWSERHWELVGKSLDLLARCGNKLCVVPLAIRTPAMENTESMVRWVKKADGTYDHDFKILERYLDLYAAKCGKPGILQFCAWENSDRGRLNKENLPPPPLGVTVFDPATGKTETLEPPPYGSPENEAFWKPVFDELRKRLEKRGWFDVAAALNANYCLDALPENVTVFKHLWPDGKWMSATHACPSRFNGKAKEDAMPVPYVEWVWGAGSLYNPDHGDKAKTPYYPRAWKQGNTRILLANARYGCCILGALRDQSPLVSYRMVSEAAIQGGLRGIGRIGGDFWPLPGAKPGQYQAVGGNYGGCSWRENVMSMTSPGPDGAIFNTRLESFREGLQLAEAIICVQKALEGGKVSDDLAKRAAALLDERARYYARSYFLDGAAINNGTAFLCSDWQERDRQLFALAAELARTTGK